MRRGRALMAWLVALGVPGVWWGLRRDVRAPDRLPSTGCGRAGGALPADPVRRATAPRRASRRRRPRTPHRGAWLAPAAAVRVPSERCSPQRRVEVTGARTARRGLRSPSSSTATGGSPGVIRRPPRDRSGSTSRSICRRGGRESGSSSRSTPPDPEKRRHPGWSGVRVLERGRRDSLRRRRAELVILLIERCAPTGSAATAGAQLEPSSDVLRAGVVFEKNVATPLDDASTRDPTGLTRPRMACSGTAGRAARRTAHAGKPPR